MQALGAVTGNLLFVVIVMPRGNVDVSIDVDVDWTVSGIISCNMSMNRFPGGVICTV